MRSEGAAPPRRIAPHLDIADFTAPDEVIVQFLDEGPNGEGYRCFFANWIADDIGYYGNGHGVRSQIFHTDPVKFAARRALFHPGSATRFLETAGVTA